MVSGSISYIYIFSCQDTWNKQKISVLYSNLIEYILRNTTHTVLVLLCFTVVWYRTGPRLNIKTVLATYGDFHVKDKTAVRTSYL